MGVWGRFRPLVDGESNHRVQAENKGCYERDGVSGAQAWGAMVGKTHFDVEIVGVAENSADLLSLLLHINFHFLDLARLRGFWGLGDGGRCLLIGQGSRERSSRCLEGGGREGRIGGGG